MELNTIFMIYTFLGVLMIIFNKKIANFWYNLILFYTNKLKLNDLFIFKVDSNNKNSMFFLMRSFTIMFSLAIISFCIYKLYF